MALVVNSNLMTLRSQRSLDQTIFNLSNTIRYIGSGQRVNRARDDASGLAMAEDKDGTKRAMKQAIRNAQDAISLLQTEDGGTAEAMTLLKRMKELAMQGASETLATDERGYANEELAQIQAEINRLAETLEFNSIEIGNGSRTLSFQIAEANTSASRLSVTTVDLRTSTLLGGTLSLTDPTTSQAAMTSIDNALQSLSSTRTREIGAAMNRLESAMRNVETGAFNTGAAESRIRDADMAIETADLAKHQVLQQSTIAVMGQANSIQQTAIRLLQ